MEGKEKTPKQLHMELWMNVALGFDKEQALYEKMKFGRSVIHECFACEVAGPGYFDTGQACENCPCVWGTEEQSGYPIRGYCKREGSPYLEWHRAHRQGKKDEAAKFALQVALAWTKDEPQKAVPVQPPPTKYLVKMGDRFTLSFQEYIVARPIINGASWICLIGLDNGNIWARSITWTLEGESKGYTKQELAPIFGSKLGEIDEIYKTRVPQRRWTL